MPGRRTRGVTVDYRALDGADSDEDFNLPTPPTKRPRTLKASQRAAEFADGAGPSHGRPSLDDKLFKKQLKVALERSRNDCQDTINASSDEHGVGSTSAPPGSQDEVSESPKLEIMHEDASSQDSVGEAEWTAEGKSSSDDSECSSDASNYSEDEFKLKTEKEVTKRRMKANKSNTIKPKARSSIGLTSAKSRRSAPGKSAAQSDFRSRSSDPPARIIASPARKSPAESLAVVSTPPMSKPVPNLDNRAVGSPMSSPVIEKSIRSAKQSAKSASHQPVSEPAPSESALRTPKWRPPARISEANSEAPKCRLISPSGGGLRLGLSRNVRLKPLHPSAKPVT